MGIYSVGIESMYQIAQFGKTKCFVGVSQESLTRELLAKHSCLHPILTFRIPIMCKTHTSLHGKLSCEIPARTLLTSIAGVFTHTLSNTQPLQSNPTINTEYKKIEYNYN